MSYARRASAVVIVEWIFFILPVIFLIILVGAKFKDFVAAVNSYDDSVRTTAIIYAVLVPIGVLTGLLINILLTNGVTKAHSTSLKIWYIISIVLTVLYVINSVRSLVAVVSTGILIRLLLTLLLRFTVLAYKVWSIHVIIQFRRELTTLSSSGEDGGVVYSFPAAPNP